MTFLEVNISMADTSNLSKFLTDVAQAIRDKKGSDAKIPAKNFDTEIADITTGIDTSDATASASDIVRGKSAYVDGTKVEGTLTEVAANNWWQQSESNLTEQGPGGIVNMQIRFGMDAAVRTGATVNSSITKANTAAAFGITADKIVAGNTILDIEGTGGGGIDTSDATATSSDIVFGKTAYVNGEKIEGSVYEVPAESSLTLVGSDVRDFPSQNKILVECPSEADVLFRLNSGADIMTSYDKVVNAIGLTSDKLVTGNTILGVEGTAEIGGGETGVKLFETIDEMQADAGAKEGDLAVVYRNELQPITVDSRFSKAVFPEVVVLPSAMTDYADLMFRAVDDSIMFDCWGQLDSSYFMMDCYTETGNVRIQYESSDGITYNRTRLEGDGVDGNSVDFGTEIYYAYPEMWNDVIGYFIQAGGMYFEGLYKYNSKIADDVYIHLPLKSGISVTQKSSGDGFDVVWDGSYSAVLLDEEKTKSLAHKLYADLLPGGAGSTKMRMFLDRNNELYAFLTRQRSDNKLVNSNATNFVYSSDGVYLGLGITDSSSTNEYGLCLYKLDLEAQTYTLVEEDLSPIGKFTGTSETATYFDVDCATCVLCYDANLFLDCRSNVLVLADTIYYYNYSDDTLNYQDVAIYHGRYLPASSQLSALNPGQLLTNVMAYGSSGVVVGDGSIYENLDSNAVNSTVLNLDESLVVSKSPYGYDGWIRGVDSTQQMISYSGNSIGDAYIVHADTDTVFPYLTQSVKYDENTVIGVHYDADNKTLTAYRYVYDTKTLSSYGTITDIGGFTYNGTMIAIDENKENVYFGSRYGDASKGYYLRCYKIDLINNTFAQICEHYSSSKTGLDHASCAVIVPKYNAVYMDCSVGIKRFNFDGTSTIVMSKSEAAYDTLGASQGFNSTKYLQVKMTSSGNHVLYDIDNNIVTDIGHAASSYVDRAWEIDDTVYVYYGGLNALNIIRDGVVISTISKPFGSNKMDYSVFPNDQPFIYDNKIIVQAYNNYLFDLTTHDVNKIDRILHGDKMKLLYKQDKNMDIHYMGVGTVRFHYIDIHLDNTGEFLAFKTSEGKYYLRKYEYDYLGEYGCLPSVKNS